ncbi:hypothetical protein F5Y06DRAFT_300103 [Hypoxylon sp. FL0890]|nr:hypothetical protein F5Y06DRAFT_300103 [Hypoxylon sp. FL0890]
MEGAKEKARASWADAQNIRSNIMGKVSSRDATKITSRFEEAEQTFAEFRLACMNVINYDLEYAVSKKVEFHLWHAHTYLNSEYRKVMSRLLQQNQVVVRRKLEKQYRAFLKTSQSFYVVYIQRLSGRFFIPELHHVAHGTDIESTEIPAPDSTPPSNVRAIILKSCRDTLIHLGDLVRYRCQISEKLLNSNFDKALEYYGLADTIDPDDGSAHHQMAVLYQLQDRHLDIVYHFHRSISIAKPHEYGITNLERKFKALEKASAAKKGSISDKTETMITWFLRLHSYFFQGEPFSQQSELEEEVLHRLEISMRSDADEAILRKMIFINIAAYDVALEKVKSSWTYQGSQSAQFLLRFNIRTVLILLRVLKAGLLDESATAPAPEGAGEDEKDAESPICFSQTLMKLFPLFRVYISWIYVCRADANNYREYLEPYISDVYRLLADTLTLLNATIDQAVATTPSKYLLPEDLEALGLRPLSDRNLPLFVYAEELPDVNPPKKHKVRKPRQRVFGRKYQPWTEAIWRMRDIVYCGVLLAGSSSYPLTMAVTNLEGRDIECWNVEVEPSQRVSIDEASMARMLNKLRLGDMKANAEDSAPKVADNTAAKICGEDETDPTPQRDLNKGKSVEERESSSLLDTDLSGDSEMVNMVNKLLDPTDDSRPQSSQTQGETSYGMNTATANEVFGQFTTNSTQRSPVSKTIPSLPWGYFYEPTPQRSGSQTNNQLTSDGDYIPRSANGQLNHFNSSPYMGALGVSASAQAHRNAREAIAHDPAGLSRGPSAFGNHQNKGSRDSLEMSRNAVLDSLTSALYAQHGLTPNNAQPSDSYTGRMSANPFIGQSKLTPGMSGAPFSAEASSPYLGTLGTHLGPSYMERSASQRSAASNLQSPLGSAGFGQTIDQHGGYQDARSHSQNVSSPVGNEAGFPPRSQGLANNRVAPGPPQQYSPWPQEPVRSGSSFAFSHPSSLIGGTPAAPAAPTNMIFSNGNYYNASNPFGRLGPGNNRDDPTRYRNQIKNYLGEEDITYDYDKNALYSALLDDNEVAQHRK